MATAVDQSPDPPRGVAAERIADELDNAGYDWVHGLGPSRPAARSPENPVRTGKHGRLLRPAVVESIDRRRADQKGEVTPFATV